MGVQGTDIEVDAYSAFAWPSEPSVTQSIEKGTSQASACQDSPLASYLISHGAKKLVIVGIATDVCVKATAEDALACGFDIILVEEAMKGVDAENSARTVQEFGKREGVRLCKTIQELHEAIV